jgi:eukaryotic-like serine/threonine-protein kinase
MPATLPNTEMESCFPPRAVFRFGLFEADAARCALNRDGVRVKIQDQPFRVLVMLLERAGEIVTREELRQSVWPDGTHVDFDGSLNVILKKLRAAIDDDSDNPRFIETVPRRGYRFIAPVSVSVATPSTELPPRVAVQNVPPPETTRECPPSAVPPAPQSNQLRPPFLAYAASVLAIAALIVAARFAWYRRAAEANRLTLSAAASGPVLARPSVAVLGFRNITGRSEDAWLSTAFSEMLRTELAGGEKLRLVPGEEVANLRLTAPWPQVDILDQKTAAHIGSVLNSDLLVLGSYTVIGTAERGQLRLDVRLESAKTGESVAEVAQTGTTQDLFRVVSLVGSALRDRLGIPELAESEEAGVVASLPLDRNAARFYGLGVAKLREYDASGAKDLLQQASAADPKFPLAHAMLARALSQLGYEEQRKREVKEAFELSANLPVAERLQVEGDYYESLADHDKAASTYRALFELFPDSLEYGLQLADAQNAAGHGSQAMATIARLRRLPAPASDDPRIDLLESRAMPNDRPGKLALVRTAERKATAQGNKVLYAQARKEECMALNYGPEPAQGLPACQDAYDTYLAAGNRLGAADAIRLMGDCEGSQGHVREAIATYQKALDLLQGLGEHEKTGAVLNNMAINFTNQGNLDRAEQLYRQAMSHFEQAGDKGNTGTALVNIADILYLKGNLPDAEKLYTETIAIDQSLDHGDPSYVLYRMSDLQLTQGHVREAHRLAQQAIDSLQRTQAGFGYLSEAMIQLGEVLKTEGDLQAARKQFADVVDIQKRAGDMNLVEESEAELADLAIEEGRPEEAESLLRPAIAEFEKESSDPAASTAYTQLSTALLMEGKLAEADKALERAIEAAHNSPNPELTLPVAIQQARIDTAAAGQDGQDAAGRAALQAVIHRLHSTIASAKKLGYYGLECEARLALGEAELKVDPAKGRSLLQTLREETHERGFELLSRKSQQRVLLAQSGAPRH